MPFDGANSSAVGFKTIKAFSPEAKVKMFIKLNQGFMRLAYFLFFHRYFKEMVNA